jgi:hypothetical protein
MSVRLKLLGGVLAIAAMMVVTGLVVLRTDERPGAPGRGFHR